MSGMEEIYAKFVSQKISKTRWRPVPPGSLQTTETFATGSWDNEVFLVWAEKSQPAFLEPRPCPPAREISRLLAPCPSPSPEPPVSGSVALYVRAIDGVPRPRISLRFKLLPFV